MRWSNIVNTDDVRRTIEVLKPDHQLFEIRILGTNRKNIISGYFTDVNVLLSAFDKVDLREQNVYITLNKVNEALYSRTQHDRFVSNTNTTSDPEIDEYQWLFIDFDPVRPANISSTDAELHASKLLKDKVLAYLTGAGFPAPVEAISGNGYHLLYRINLPTDQEHIDLISNCLNALATLFNNSVVKVDTTNYNPSRICKLHGTLAQKGANTETRPHRMSSLLSVPDVIETVPEDKLRVLAAELPEKPVQKIAPRTYTSPSRPTFDLKDFMARNGITYKEDVGRDCQMYLLDECPFDHNHRNGDAKIFAYTNGAIAFKCHHNSCKGKKWQDVRLLFEPDAYDQKADEERIENGYIAHRASVKAKQVEPDIPLPGDEVTQPRPVKEKKSFRPLISAVDLMKEHYDPPVVYVGVGSEEPMLVEGTSLLSAKPKLGKSWLVLDMGIAIARGDDFLEYKTKQCSVLYLDLETSKQLQQVRIKKALNGRPVPDNFYIDTEADTLDNGFIAQIEHYLTLDPRIGVVIIDVFQIIRSRAVNSKEQEYEHVYRDITPLNQLAQTRHISIVLVCHDRKMVDPEDPFSNILGSTGLQGAATQMIVMFRRKKSDPIHISIKGKTIDALPELDVVLENGQWRRVEASNRDSELDNLEQEYKNSIMRQAVILIAEHGAWRGRCTAIIETAADLGMLGFNADVTPKMMGGFLHRHRGRFMKFDHIQIDILDNGTAPKIYRIYKVPVITDGEKEIPLMDWEDAQNNQYIPFEEVEK